MNAATNAAPALADVVRSARRFADEQIDAYLREHGAEDRYPVELISAMGELGLFGLTVPPEHGGLGLGRDATAAVVCEIASGWQSLAALLGTHWRVCLYVQQCGTGAQREELLPRLATGALSVGHAYHEQGVKDLAAFDTTLERRDGRTVLSGRKQWCTNARDANLLVVIARAAGEMAGRGSVAVIVDPTRPEVRVGAELPRPGVRGVSLAAVEFTDYPVDVDEHLVGGLDADIDAFIERFEGGSSLAFAARAVGAARAAATDLRAYLGASTRTGAAEAITRFRYAEIDVRLRSMQAMLTAAIEDGSAVAAHAAKVFCSTELQQLVADCMMLKGGASYADESTVMSRVFRDAASLRLIDTPNDILLSRIGDELLDDRPPGA